jgi:hypothetical protein
MMVAISFIRWIVALMDRKAVTAWAVCLMHGGDLAADVLGRLRGLGGQPFHLAGDHGKALAWLASAGGLDGGSAIVASSSDV